MTYPCRHISIAINRSPGEVYEFASNPMNLPRWAAGLSQSTISKSEDGWIADSPMGQVRVWFAKHNDFGVMDHDVKLPSGEVNHNPFRVVANGDGSEVIFTLYQLPRMSAQDFEADAQLILADLRKLKALLESSGVS